MSVRNCITLGQNLRDAVLNECYRYILDLNIVGLFSFYWAISIVMLKYLDETAWLILHLIYQLNFLFIFYVVLKTDLIDWEALLEVTESCRVLILPSNLLQVLIILHLYHSL